MTKTDIKLIIKAKPACRRGGWYKEKLPNCTKQALRFGGGGWMAAMEYQISKDFHNWQYAFHIFFFLYKLL